MGSCLYHLKNHLLENKLSNYGTYMLRILHPVTIIKIVDWPQQLPSSSFAQFVGV